MSDFYVQLSYLSFALALAVAVGGLIPLGLSWTRNHLPAILSFAAGIMLGAALLHLLPEAYALDPKHASLWILLGFLFLYAFEKFVTVHICEALDCEVHSIGISAFIGLAIHALTEGLALGAGLLIEGIGLIVFFSIFIHKIPAAFALTAILINERYRKSTIVILQAIFILMVPIGALLVHWLAAARGLNILGPAVAFSTGTFLHISLSDLLPEVHRSSYRRSLTFITFLLGLLIMIAIKYIDFDLH